ncbi:hypothetical protein V6M93_00545 [Pectobacterium brasiliense]|uniref:hypothetical protein n=1 Tax=Pectobacterium brasiliense TaxID=180957 RepID=UPI00366C5913
MDLNDIGGLNPMTISERSEAIGTHVRPNLTGQHGRVLNLGIANEACEHNVMSIRFQR